MCSAMSRLAVSGLTGCAGFDATYTDPSTQDEVGISAMGKIRARLVSQKQVRTGCTAGRQYLTGPDIFGGMVTVPLFYVYPQGLDPEVVERSLAITLKKYPLVAGRMKKDDAGYPYIDADDSGVPFSVYDVDGPLPAYGPGNPIQKDAGRYYRKVFPWTIYKPDTALFSVRIFRFEDGGVVASLDPVHTLIDGSSVWMFMEDWSRAAQGLGEPEDIVERDFLLNLSKQHVGRPYNARFASSMGLWKRLGLYARLALQAASNKLEVHRIPAWYLAELREQFLQEYPGTPKISDVDLITARCLKEIARLQHYRRDLSLGIVVDFRFKRSLEIPRRLFGVAIGQEEREFTASQLSQGSVASLAMKIRQPEVRQTTEDWQGYLGFMESQRQGKGISSVIPRSVTEGLKGGFMQNNYCAMPVYEADLGSGKPTWYSPLAVPFRMVKIVPTVEADGSVDLHLILSRREREAFRKLFADLT